MNSAMNDPILQQALAAQGETSPNAVNDPILQQAIAMQDNTIPTGQPVNPIMNALNQSAQYASVPYAGALNLLNKGEDYLHQGANYISPTLGKLIPKGRLNPNEIAQIPNTPGFNNATNIASGVEGALIPGPDIFEGANLASKLGNFGTSQLAPQALIGATLNPNNRMSGATSGALGSLFGGTGNALASMSDRGVNAIREFLQPNKFAQQGLNDVISGRMANKAVAKQNYGIISQVKNESTLAPGQNSNQVADEMESLFGKTPATQYFREDPTLGGRNTGEIPTPQEQTSSQVHAMFEPNFRNALSKATGGANSSEMQAYDAYASNPTVENANNLQHELNSSALNPGYSAAEQNLFGRGASVAKNNIVKTLQRHDALNNTNLTAKYISADPMWAREKQFQNLGNGYNAMTAGQLPLNMRNAQYISSVLDPLAAKGLLQQGTPEFNLQQALYNKMQASNNLFPGVKPLIRYSQDALLLPKMIGSMMNYSSPLVRGILQTRNASLGNR